MGWGSSDVEQLSRQAAMLCPKRVARSLLMDVERSITFNPPLYLQRRIWALDIMRRENITDVRTKGNFFNKNKAFNFDR